MIAVILLILVIVGFVIWFIIETHKGKHKESTEEPEKPIDEKPKEPQIIKPEEPVVVPVESKPIEETPKKPALAELFEEIFPKFEEITGNMGRNSTYGYLHALFAEAYYQYYENRTTLGLPLLIKEENFPTIINYYGDDGDEKSGFLTFAGWLFAMALSEIKPICRLQLFKTGYKLGGYDKYSNIYGYQFKYDPNVLRIAASALYAAVKGYFKWEIDKCRKELGGTTYKESLETIKESDSSLLEDTDFYIDFREFISTAPGPYAPNYKERPDSPLPNEVHTLLDNLSMDDKIHSFIVENYNLDNPVYKNRVVQAIADKETHENHLFGPELTVGEYHFKPVFGVDIIGKEISPEGLLAQLCYKCKYICSYGRDILQSKDTSPKQYGRLRPGCSWKQEATVHSTTDDRWNVLVNFPIEDNDGCPTGYYNKNGEWVYPDEISSEEEFVKYFKKKLWANSYPSGHSAAIMGVALILIELYPQKADLILRAANNFALSRTIARYHWTSDTIVGRLVGAATCAVCHAVEEFITIIDKLKNER